MRKWLTVGILALGIAFFAANCGGRASTITSTEATTTTSLTTTTTTATPTISAGSTTTSAFTAAPLTIELTGDQVVPPVQTDATGTLKLSVDLSKGISYELDAQNIADVIAAGIYLGAKGSNGTLVVKLLSEPPPSGPFNGVLAQGSITDADLTGPLQGKSIQEIIPFLALSGGGAYVQVTTKTYPAGEIRGDIAP